MPQNKIFDMTIFKRTFQAACLFSAVTLAATAAPKDEELVIGENAHWEAAITTSKGLVTIELYNDTPIHRDNFVKLAEEGFYNSLLFHRVIDNFMIQTGDPTSKEALHVRKYGDEDAGYKLPAEINPRYRHFAGTVAAAREGDEMNPERESSSSQFYIVSGGIPADSVLTEASERIAAMGDEMTPAQIETYQTEGGAAHLDGKYTIFGRVVSGMGTVYKIAKVKTDANNRPKQDVFIEEIKLKKVQDKRK